MPAPSWLITPILPAGGLVGLYGQPGVCKSFVAIDMAMSIATGLPWQGLPTEKGFVIYISAEGGTGIGKRVLAWLAHHQVEPRDADIAWLVESIPVNTDSEEMATLLNRIVDEIERPPDYIVVDTLARCFDGDENQQEDMGRFVAGVDMLRKEFGCTVTVVHHTNLSGLRERGNTAFRGATDTMIMIEKEDTQVTVTCTKQKDAEEFEPIELELQKVDGTDSCIVQGAQSAQQRQDIAAEVLNTLSKLQPCRWDDWREATGLNRSKFQKSFQLLRRNNQAIKGKGGLWTIPAP